MILGAQQCNFVCFAPWELPALPSCMGFERHAHACRMVSLAFLFDCWSKMGGDRGRGGGWGGSLGLGLCLSLVVLRMKLALYTSMHCETHGSEPTFQSKWWRSTKMSTAWLRVALSVSSACFRGGFSSRLPHSASFPTPLSCSLQTHQYTQVPAGQTHSVQ